MGIRFHCPNGHKLNVKAFLAGKKGVCPDCGARVRIPDRSEPGLDSGVGKDKHAAPATQPANGTAVPSAVGQMPARPAAPVAQSNHAPAASRPAPQQVTMQPAVVPMTAIRPAVAAPAPLPPPPPMGRAPDSPLDPIAENPLATWYVRPPSGGQFGPARGEVMRKWLTEGRVTSDSLVWREGWPDWLPATEVFPSLGKPTPPLVQSSPVTSTTAASQPAKKSTGMLGVVLLVMLALFCVALTAVLGYVVLSGRFSST